jgi:four helix bundle protein
MNGHKDLLTWQEAMDLALEVYEITCSFPKNETYGLTSQIRRSVVSIPSNIAEGAGRGSQKEFNKFLLIARGSLSELETQLILAHKLNYIDELIERVIRLFKLIAGLRNSLQK